MLEATLVVRQGSIRVASSLSIVLRKGQPVAIMPAEEIQQGLIQMAHGEPAAGLAQCPPKRVNARHGRRADAVLPGEIQYDSSPPVLGNQRPQQWLHGVDIPTPDPEIEGHARHAANLLCYEGRRKWQCAFLARLAGVAGQSSHGMGPRVVHFARNVEYAHRTPECASGPPIQLTAWSPTYFGNPLNTPSSAAALAKSLKSMLARERLFRLPNRRRDGTKRLDVSDRRLFGRSLVILRVDTVRREIYNEYQVFVDAERRLVNNEANEPRVIVRQRVNEFVAFQPSVLLLVDVSDVRIWIQQIISIFCPPTNLWCPRSVAAPPPCSVPPPAIASASAGAQHSRDSRTCGMPRAIEEANANKCKSGKRSCIRFDLPSGLQSSICILHFAFCVLHSSPVM